MQRKTRARLWITTTASIAAAVVVTLAYPHAPAVGEVSVVNVSAPATGETCSPCHPEPGASRNPNVIFDHAAHLLTQCTACHNRPAHEGGVPATPEMPSCFTCHGLFHGPMGALASGQCADCHPAGFTLRPASHVEDWPAKPHADASAGGVNTCLMCHNPPEDCDVCHQEAGVEIGPMPTIYLSTLPKASTRPAASVDLAAPVSISQCVYCHPRIDAFSVDGLVFAHAKHLERAYRCEACHTSFPHGPNGTKRPPMRDCTRCHGLTHNGSGLVAAADCLKCHTAEFNLTPPDHTVEFLSGKHKDPATSDPAYCAQCHAPASCVECHNGGTKLADGRKGEMVIPDSHKGPEWSKEHGGLYLEQKGLCVVCHTSEYCQQCHQTTMPHPATWLADHAQGNGSLAKDCGVCHTDREVCQDCHHSTVRSADLVLENCVKCHEEMATDPPTDIQNAGLAEHAVHFQVALPEKKGEPYKCEDCHIGFGVGGVRILSPATGPHDMRICYECHGALDFENALIAPYRGAELCLRCHKDLL
ncbi:MAG: hypothetical protein EG823_06925 [Actinobacteria bacterium]|nr:hypothetical protein [Actinomycetota bacterium]